MPICIPRSTAVQPDQYPAGNAEILTVAPSGGFVLSKNVPRPRRSTLETPTRGLPVSSPLAFTKHRQKMPTMFGSLSFLGSRARLLREAQDDDHELDVRRRPRNGRLHEDVGARGRGHQERQAQLDAADRQQR